MADAPLTDLPAYQESGLRSSCPGPFHCRDAHMHIAVLQGRADRIAELVAKMLDGPAKGKVRFRATGSRVLLVWGDNLVSSATPPWDERGKVYERLASFWVPVQAGHGAGEDFTADRLCMYVPHVLVDNPMSLVTGREIYGFPKALGRFSDGEDGCVIEGYGGDFAPDALPEWRPLLEIRPSAGATSEATGPDSVAELVDGLADALAEEGFAAGPRELCHALRTGEFPMLFLKQLRDAWEPERACYQHVVEAPSKITKLSGMRPSAADWDVTIHPLQSHPIAEELGLEQPHARWSARVHFDFDVERGRAIAP